MSLFPRGFTRLGPAPSRGRVYYTCGRKNCRSRTHSTPDPHNPEYCTCGRVMNKRSRP